MKTLLVVIEILGLSFSVFLTAYGISAGLFNKRILSDGWTKSYDTGSRAVRRGWFYIVVGVILFAIFVAALVRL